MSALNENAITRLATVKGVDMNSATPVQLYVVPAGKQLAVLYYIVRNASISLTTAAFSIGYNSPTFDNLFNNATHTTLTASNIYSEIIPYGVSHITGGGGDALTLLVNTLQGAAATVDIDIFGYLI